MHYYEILGGCLLPDSPDKVAERWFAKFLGGVRHASQGVSHADVSSDVFVVEHKYRKLDQYSAEFRKAIAQHDANRERENKGDKREPIVCFTFHGTRGQNARRFIMFEVFPKDVSIDNWLKKLIEKVSR